VPRLQMKSSDQKTIKKIRSMPFLILNNILTTADKNRMERYSAKKITTNVVDLYSVLNPLTNSDSPSEKSKGERLDSARDATNNINIVRKRKIASGERFGLIRS